MNQEFVYANNVLYIQTLLLDLFVILRSVIILKQIQSSHILQMDIYAGAPAD
jgi:hypothetical protein